MDKQVLMLNEFKRSLVNFLDELVEMFPNESDFITLRILIKDQVPISTIMDIFIKDLDNIMNCIATKDEKFFTSGNMLFAQLGKEQKFAQIWRSSVMDNENKNIMWKWMLHLVTIAQKYISLNHN